MESAAGKTKQDLKW